MICNTKPERFQKDGKEFEAAGEHLSIYVEETSRSLHERAPAHWNDFHSRKQYLHILKHWIIRVIKYCRDAMSRQVGEAVRISYREQTLNSQSGYNRSGISRK